MPAVRSPNLLLRQQRLSRGWSQVSLVAELRRRAGREGERLPDSEALVSMISRWENGHRHPNVFYRYLLRQTYGKSDAALGFPDVTEAELLPERTSVPLPGTRPDGLSPPARMDEALLDDLASLTDVYRRMDRRLGAPGLVDDLGAHLRRVTELKKASMTEGHRSRLATIAADAAALLGWQALDMGEPVRAWSAFRVGGTAAQEADQPTLRAFITAEMGYVPLLHGQPRQALSLLDEAESLSAKSATPTFVAWLSAAKAEAHALLGDTRGTMAALQRADTAIDRATAGEETIPAVSYFDQSHLLRWKGQCLALVDRASEAEPILQSAVKAVDLSFVRARSGMLLDLANCHLAQDGLEEACVTACQALRLARDTRSARYQQRVWCSGASSRSGPTLPRSAVSTKS